MVKITAHLWNSFTLNLNKILAKKCILISHLHQNDLYIYFTLSFYFCFKNNLNIYCFMFLFHILYNVKIILKSLDPGQGFKKIYSVLSKSFGSVLFLFY